MDTQRQRHIVIVGRPNVGKSALFNRIAGRRLAIVHEQSGVTRDRLACEVTWKDERFELIDTGGLSLMDKAEARDLITDGTRKQVDAALEDASVLILVVDITKGITPMDREVARLIKESGRPAVVAANKSDHEGLDVHGAEFEALGFPVHPVAAIHNRGIDELMKAAMKDLPPYVAAEEKDVLSVAIVGRPNAGKSSYINRLLRSERVIVSDIPGTTRDSIEIPFTVGSGPQVRHYELIDTAGIRHARKVKEAVDKFSLIRAEGSIKRADVVVLMLDATQGPTLQDKKIANLIDKHNKGCLLMINKWDLAKDEVTQRKYGAALQAAVPFLSFAPVVFVSAQSGYNIRKSIEAIDYVASQIEMDLSTGVLNRVLHDAFGKVQPPMVKGKRLKFYYATQVRKKPIAIRLFVNDPDRRSSSYETYLVKRIREAYGLEGAPVRLQWRTRSSS